MEGLYSYISIHHHIYITNQLLTCFLRKFPLPIPRKHLFFLFAIDSSFSIGYTRGLEGGQGGEEEGRRACGEWKIVGGGGLLAFAVPDFPLEGCFSLSIGVPSPLPQHSPWPGNQRRRLQNRHCLILVLGRKCSRSGPSRPIAIDDSAEADGLAQQAAAHLMADLGDLAATVEPSRRR